MLLAGNGALREVLGDDEQTLQFLYAVRRAMLYALRAPIEDRPLLNNKQALFDYLQAVQGFATVEHARAIFLDSGNHLLREELVAEGTVDEIDLHVRMVIGRALELGAAGLILVHNHPSGDPTPSQGDRTVTRRLASAGQLMDVHLLDHLIIGRGRHFSFREAGFL